MLRYRIIKNQIKTSPAYGKYYGKLLHEILTYEEFIEHLAAHNTSFTEGTFQAVLTDTMNCLRELLLLGKAVRLGDMGIFSLGAITEGTETAKDIDKEHKTGFHVANIKGLRVNWYLGKKFNAQDLFDKATFKEATAYTPDEGDGGNGSGNDSKADTDKDEKPTTPSGSGNGGSSSSGGSSSGGTDLDDSPNGLE